MEENTDDLPNECDIDIKSEISSCSDAETFEPEPLVYEIQKKRKKNQTEPEFEKDPLKVEPDDDYAQDDFDNACNTDFDGDITEPSNLQDVAAEFEEKVACQYCCDVFKNIKKLNKHIHKKHKANELTKFSEHNDLVCSICTLLFSNLNKLKMHLRRKHNIFEETSILKCEICGLSYDKPDSLQKHVKRKHSLKKGDVRSEARVVDCEICGMIYSNRFGLSKHMRWSHKIGVAEAVFSCDRCGEGFPRKSALQSHLGKAHSLQTYTCTSCGAQFKLKDSFRRHVNRKHAIAPKRNAPRKGEYKCGRCSYETEHWNELTSHYKKTHLDKTHHRRRKAIEKTTCQFCGIQLNVYALPKHIRGKHKSVHKAASA